eukprot:gene17604-23177_t
MFIVITYNFGFVGVYSIFSKDGIPSYITQGYLISTSVILAWQLSQFDEWTTWSLLVLLSFYDLCAVLTPCGPLKALVNIMQQRPNDQLPGLLYEAHLPTDETVNTRSENIEMIDIKQSKSKINQQDKEYIISTDLNYIEKNNSNDEGEGEVKERERDRIRLGLGDFVFYSVLVSRAATHGFLTFISTFLVILTGLGVTLILLSIYKQALPALPISILFGVSIYFLVRFFLVPFVNDLTNSGIYL